MVRRGEDFTREAVFDDLSGVHHRDAVGNARHHAEIVRDQHHGDAELALELRKQAQDLGLDGHVERGARLVGNQQLRSAHQGHGDHHALAQASGELVRILAQALGGRRDADLFQKVHRTRPRLVGAGAAVMEIRLHQLVADGVRRIESGHRLLEDHRHPAAAQRIDAPAARSSEILAEEVQAPGTASRRLRQQAHDRQRSHRLAAAGFTDDAQRLAAPRLEAEVAHRVQRAVCRGDVDVQAVHVEHDRALRGIHDLPSGDSRSCRPSPHRLMAKISTARAVPGIAISQKEKNM